MTLHNQVKSAIIAGREPAKPYYKLALSPGYCLTHHRAATHLLVREGESDERHCDPDLAGILACCRVVALSDLTVAQRVNDLAMQGFTVYLATNLNYCLLFREWSEPRELRSDTYETAVLEAWHSMNPILNERARLSLDKSPRSAKCISNE